MKILIVSTVVPFIKGGGTFIVDWLDEALKQYGHQSDVINIPFHSYYNDMLEQMLALRLLDVSESADRLIAIRTPSYLIKHPNKVLWFIHHHRGAYDLWGTRYQDIPNTPEGLRIRDAFIQADNVAFKEAKRIFTNSKVVSDRLKYFNDVDSEVLYPPLINYKKYYCAEYCDYIFYPSRLANHKRQNLAIEAMCYTKSNVKLIVAGSPESQDYLDQMKSMIHKNRLENVTLIDRWISDEEKIDLYANSLGCVYIPLDEDSYGYPSLESYYSRKPVITCTDSGGTLEIIEDEMNGFIVAPEAKAIAASFDRLYNDKQLAKKMGEDGLGKLKSMNITVDNMVRRLTE